MWSNVLTNLLITVAVAVMGVIAKVITDWSAREKVKVKERVEHNARYDMIEALEIGVLNTQEAIVNDLKEKASDGKLSGSDIRSIQGTAIREATKILSGPGAELIVNTGFDILGSLITGIVNSKKEPQK